MFGNQTATIGDIKTIKLREKKIELMLNIILARAENLKPTEQIDLDVDGFIYDKINDDNENIILDNNRIL